MKEVTFMTSPRITSFTESGNIDAGASINRVIKDSAGNTLEANTANPSGHTNYANLKCSNGQTLDVSRDAKDIIRQAREAAPSTLLGVTLSEGGPSPLAPICNAGGKPGQTR